ncbi:type I CRISPR-associated protein Cas7 [Candidatus Magnetominusculus dajiuhuensis]|uniref:type I CRISPR-associated protein Cas7 n=1 Tax=Candidatus Magnetominusculus dajiuhuensis TaxID=3137712 RepID=UPI003B430C5F
MDKQNDGNGLVNRATGLLIIEVRSSNPNGDPDRESDPRQRYDDRGEISPVSFKRKVRDLIENKEGTVWTKVSGEFNPTLDAANFHILESRGRDRKKIETEINTNEGVEFRNKYWDGRVFGNTFLEEGSSTSIRTGVVQFGLGISIAPIEIERSTNTSKSGVQEGKDRGMAPLGYRIITHGVYYMPFLVNPTAARTTGCTYTDIKLLKKIIPYAYSNTPSYVRSLVEIRHAWYIEHKSQLGSCSDFMLIDALTPKKKDGLDPEKPSKSWDEYDVPTTLPDNLEGKVESLSDLMDIY